MRTKTRPNRSKSVAKKQSDEKKQKKTSRNAAMERDVPHHNDEPPTPALPNITITPQQYLLYLHYTTTQLSHHLSQSHHVSLLYEYLMDANLLLRQLNLFCSLRERQERRQRKKSQWGLTAELNFEASEQFAPENRASWVDSANNGSSGSLQTDTPSNGTTDTNMKRIQSLQSVSEGNSSTSDLFSIITGNTKSDLATQQLERDTLANATVHNMHYQDLLTESGTYSNLLHQVSRFLKQCDEHMQNNQRSSAQDGSNTVTDDETSTIPIFSSFSSQISSEQLELMRWLYSVLRTQHAEYVLQNRPEEFASLILGRVWQDIDIDNEFLDGLEIYQKVVPQLQEQSNFRNPAAQISSPNPKTTRRPSQLHTTTVHTNKSQGSFSFPSSNDSPDTLPAPTPMDTFIYSVQQLQKFRSWLIPFSRLTGLAKSTKYMNEIVCEGKPSTVVVSPTESHVYVTMRDAGGSFCIVDRFFGSRVACNVRPCVGSMVTGTDTGVTFSRAINSFCLTPDGRRIVIACQDSSIRVIDAFSGDELLVIDDLDEPITCGKVSIDGNLYVAACGSQLCLFDLSTGEFIDAFKGHTGRILSLDLNKDFIVSGAEDNMIIKWSIRTGKIELRINTQYDYHVSCLVISPHNDHIFSVENFRYYVDIWCAHTGSHKQFLMDRGSVQQIVLDSSGIRLFTVIDEKVWIWNVHTAQKVSRIFVNSKIRNIFLSDDSQTLYTLSDDCVVRNFELNNNFVTEDLDDRHPSSVMDVSLCQHPMTKHSVILSVARGEKLVYMWHFEPGILQRKIEIRDTAMDFVCITNFTGLLMVLAKDVPQNADSSAALTIESASGYILRCFDILQGEGKLMWGIELPFNKKSNDVVNGINVSKDDQYVIITYDADIVVVPVHQPIKFFSGFIENKERVRSVIISRAENEVVTGDSNGNVRKWNLSDSSLSQKFQVSRWRRNRCQCVFVCRDSNFVLVGSSQHSKWISLHDQSDWYCGFPQSLFSREALTHAGDAASGRADVLSQVNGDGSPGPLSVHSPDTCTNPSCAECSHDDDDDSAPLQDIDETSTSLLQTHERIAREFSGTSSPMIAITADQRFIVCGDDRGCIRVWDADKKLFICSYTLEHACTVLKVRALSSVEEDNGSEGKFFVLLCGDAGGRVTCLEASLESASLERFSGK